jgi:DNA-binding FadR family transcriptional regulator
VHQAVVDIIEHKIATATNAASLKDRSIVLHRQVLAAIRAGDGELAARLGREAL